MSKLTHINANGEAQMVDVSDKNETAREAKACARVVMKAETLDLIVSGSHKKGDVLAVARVAGIQAAKKCSDLIPLCHPLMLSKVSVELTPNTQNNCIDIIATAKLTGKTGVEMEAVSYTHLTLPTIYSV